MLEKLKWILSKKTFVKEKMAEANWLKNALQKRNDTMLRVATEIAKTANSILRKRSRLYYANGIKRSS